MWRKERIKPPKDIHQTRDTPDISRRCR